MTSDKVFPEGNKQSPLARVLLVDDDAPTRELMGACVQRAGWELETLPAGSAALERISQEPFDVVVADLLLPSIDGISLLRQMRIRRPGQAIILVSSSSSVGDLVKFMKEGVTDVLQKPLDSDTLARTVARVISSVRAREKEQSYFRFATEDVVEFDFASHELAECRVPITVLDRLLQAGKIDLQAKLQLELAFQEALANALEHGNLELESAWKEEFDAQGIDRFSTIKRERLKDPQYAERRVGVRFEYSGKELRLVVSDQGKGFVPKTQKLRGINAEIPHGRGLAIIFAATDEVIYAAKGTQVTLIKLL